MANSTLTLTISLMMIALFSVAILGYAFNFAVENDAAISVADDPAYSSLNISTRANTSTFNSESESTYQSITESEVKEGSDVLTSASSFTVTTGNVFSITKNIFTVGYEKIFGDGDTFGIFLTAFFGVIGLMFALYVIKTWRGQP